MHTKETKSPELDINREELKGLTETIYAEDTEQDEKSEFLEFEEYSDYVEFLASLL
jgi:hypothetical protein